MNDTLKIPVPGFPVIELDVRRSTTFKGYTKEQLIGTKQNPQKELDKPEYKDKYLDLMIQVGGQFRRYFVPHKSLERLTRAQQFQLALLSGSPDLTEGLLAKGLNATLGGQAVTLIDIEDWNPNAAFPSAKPKRSPSQQRKFDSISMKKLDAFARRRISGEILSSSLPVKISYSYEDLYSRWVKRHFKIKTDYRGRRKPEIPTYDEWQDYFQKSSSANIALNRLATRIMSYNKKSEQRASLAEDNPHRHDIELELSRLKAEIKGVEQFILNREFYISIDAFGNRSWWAKPSLKGLQNH